jgi:molybdopterin-guanine dinucleotide biosynthesis protein B
VGKPPLHPDDPYIIAIASDVPLPDAGRPVVALSDLEAIVALMLEKSEPLAAVMARLASPSPALAGT